MGINREHLQFTHAGAESVRDKIKEIGLASQSTASAMDGLKGTVIALAGAYVGLQGIKTTTNAIKEFESTMLEVKAVTRATTEDYNLLSKSARDLGASTRYSASEAGQAILALSRNGFTVNETLVSVEDSLNLAIAGVLGLQQAADITASTVRQFGLDASEAGRVTDVLVLAANNASTTVAQFSEAMSYAGTAAAAANQSLEEASGVIQVLANNNIRGSMAGTNYRSMLLSLLNPTEKAQEALKNMGLTAEDVSIKTHKFHEVFGILKNAGLDLTTAAQIFDERSATAAVTLANFNGQIEKYVQQNKNAAGAAKEAASVMDSGLKQGFLELESVIEEAMLRLGDGGFGGALNGLIIGLGDAVKLLFHFEGAMEESSTQGKILASVLGAITAAATISSMNSLVGMTVKLGIALKTAFNAHPVLMWVGAVGSLIGAIVPLVGQTTKLESAMNDITESAETQKAEYEVLSERLIILSQRQNDSVAAQVAYKKALEEIKAKYPDYLSNLDSEKTKHQDLVKVLNEQKQAYFDRIALQMREKELQVYVERQVELKRELNKAIVEAADAQAKMLKGEENTGLTFLKNQLLMRNGNSLLLESAQASIKVKDIQEEINELTEAENKIRAEYAGILTADTANKNANTIATKNNTTVITDEIKALEKLPADFSIGFRGISGPTNRSDLLLPEVDLNQSTERIQTWADENSDIIDIFSSNVSDSLSDLFTNAEASFDDFMNGITTAIIRTMTNSMVQQFFSWLSGLGGQSAGATVGGYGSSGVANTLSLGMFNNSGGLNRRELGGSYEAGVPRITGERGWEIDVPSVNGRVLSHSDAMKAVSGGGQPVNVKILNNVDEGMILQALQTNAGEKLIMNTIMKHKNMIGGY